MILFGITGRKFSGKSFAASLFRKQFIPIIDLDEMYNSIFFPGNKGHKILINSIGEDVINDNGSINTSKLSLLMCNEVWIKNLVDDILYDEFKFITKKLKTTFCAHNILLGGIESYITENIDFISNLDFIIFINSSIKERVKRMGRMGISGTLSNKILENEKFYDNIKSEYTINNNSTFVDFENECQSVIQNIKSQYIND